MVKLWNMNGDQISLLINSLMNNYKYGLNSPAISHVFLLGETKFLYEKYLKNYLDCTIVKNLSEAVKLSFSFSQRNIKENKIKNANILFSPACSSLDEWKNFEERGNAFIKYTKKI